MDNSLSGLFFGFDRLDRVVAGFEQRLGQIAEQTAADAGIVHAAGVRRYEDGTLGPVDLTAGLTGNQVAFNRAAKNHYVTRQRLDAEARASDLMRRNPLDPEAFRGEWQAYVDGTLGKVGNDATAAALSLDLTAIGNKAYAGIAQQKQEYDRKEQGRTFAERAELLSTQARSLAARSGRWDSEEITQLREELDATLGVMVQQRHLDAPGARKIQREWGEQVFLQAARTRVEAAYNAGKTPMGPGNYADAMEVAKTLSWQAAEALGLDPEDAMRKMMGLAVIAQQNKQALMTERREAMQIANERRAAANYARAEENFRQSRAAEDLQLGIALGRANGENRPLLPPGSYPGSDDVGGGSGSDQLQGGERPAPRFNSIEELVKRVGKGRAAQLIEQERAWQAQRARSETAARQQAEQEMLSSLQLGQRIQDENGRIGLQLPDGTKIFDPADMTGPALTRARYADTFYRRLKGVADEMQTRGDAQLAERLGQSRSLVTQAADEILSGKGRKETFTSIVEGIRDIANDVTLPESQRSKWAAHLKFAEEQQARVEKGFKDRAEVTELASLRATMTNDQRTTWVQLQGLDISQPDADPKAAMEKTGKFLDDLSYRNFQIDPKSAQFIAATLTNGAPRGAKGTLALEKALAVVDRLETMLPEDRARFDAEMTGHVKNWAEIRMLYPVARDLYEASSQRVTTGGVTEMVPARSWADAYGEARTSLSKQNEMGADRPPAYTADDAKAFISKNAATIAPGAVAAASIPNWAGWMLGTTQLRVPDAMAAEFAKTVEQARLTTKGSLGNEAELIAAAKLQSSGWYPSQFAATGADARPWGSATPVFKKKPIEWHVQQNKMEFGNQAILLYAAGALARERGLDPDDAWKFVSNGLIQPIQKGDGSEVEFVVHAPRGGKLPFAPAKGPDALAAFYPGGLRTTFLQDKNGKPFRVDISDPDFRQFHNQVLVTETAKRARDFDVPIPAPRDLGGPRPMLGPGSGTKPPVAHLPTGNLLRGILADPTSEIGGGGARRAFDILYERQIGNSAP